MERRETYDPEDIESLLNERSFDELLAEERAFVLRHLTGREEYEAMRNLLQQVRTEEQGPQEPIAADPHIREHVLKVYRDRQMPGWRIWLNSVQAFLLPGEAQAFWRPALAIATVLLLVTGGVFVYQKLSTSQDTMVAALEEKEESAPAPPSVAQPSGTPATDVPVAAQSAATEAGADIAREQPAPVKAVDDLVKDVTAEWTTAGETDEALAERKKVEANNEGYHTLTLDAAGNTAADSLVAFEPGSVNYVQLEDLQKNGTLTNATGAVAMEEVARLESRSRDAERNEALADAAKSKSAASRSLAQDQGLLELLNAAW